MYHPPTERGEIIPCARRIDMRQNAFCAVSIVSAFLSVPITSGLAPGLAPCHTLAWACSTRVVESAYARKRSPKPIAQGKNDMPTQAWDMSPVAAYKTPALHLEATSQPTTDTAPAAWTETYADAIAAARSSKKLVLEIGRA